jgi:hypothetical protein
VCIVTAYDILNGAKLQKILCRHLVHGDFLMNYSFVSVTVGFDDTHAFVDLFHHFGDGVRVGKGSDGEFVNAFDGRRRHGQRFDVYSPPRENDSDLIEQTNRIFRENCYRI